MLKENKKFDDYFYSDQEHLGGGGFSEVFKVHYKKDNKYYALKKLRFSVNNATEKQLKDFANEVEFLKRLDHESIVKVEDDFVIDYQPAILMELVEGKSLYQLINEKGYFTTKDVIDVAIQISAGLMVCHNMQAPSKKIGLMSQTEILTNHAIIHNDISTKNIIRQQKDDGGYCYKLIDFGLSFVNPENARSSQKQHGMMEFKSPEKWEMVTVETASDIYSFGVVLFALLTGNVPFPCDNYDDPKKELALKNSCINDPIPDIWELRKDKISRIDNIYPVIPDFPYWLNEIIMKCLEKDPENRYRSGKELNEEILKGVSGHLQDIWPQPDPKPDPKPFFKILLEKLKVLSNGMKKFVIGLIVLSFLLIGGVFLIKQFQNNSKISYTDDIEMLHAYFTEDEKAISEKEIKKLTRFFSFPLYYYEKDFSEEEFITFYQDKMSNYEYKVLDIDSIVLVPGSENTKYNVYGKLEKHKNNKKTYNSGKIKDEITLKDGKIKKIIKLQ